LNNKEGEVKKKIVAALLSAFSLVTLLGIPATAAPAQACSYVETEVIPLDCYCDGHLLCHINAHVVDFDGCAVKLDVHLRGQLLCKTECGNFIAQLNAKLICNGQTGNGGVANGMIIFSVNGPDGQPCRFQFHFTYANGEIRNCHITPI
jgi:hypothetical protein